MRLIDADAYEYPGDLVNEPTIDALVLPCPVGSDYWYIDPETQEVDHIKGGIRGFALRGEKTFALLDDTFDMVEIHSDMCCLSREEAEAKREELLKKHAENQENAQKVSK